MNANVKKAWVAALRSGEYVQGRRLLRTEGGEYCCLGVLCALAEKDGIEGINLDTSFPDMRVAQWAGLTDAVTAIGNLKPSVLDGGGCTALSYLNDTGSTFAQIADLIEEQL